MTPDGLVISLSSFGPKETMDRLVAALTGCGMSILARIDHAAAAAKVGMHLRPTEVLIFGNLRAGTPLMQATQTIGIDLPLKALVWQDSEGKTWLAYNDPAWLAKRHGLFIGSAGNLRSIADALATAAAEVCFQPNCPVSGQIAPLVIAEPSPRPAVSPSPYESRDSW